MIDLKIAHFDLNNFGFNTKTFKLENITQWWEEDDDSRGKKVYLFNHNLKYTNKGPNIWNKEVFENIFQEKNKFRGINGMPPTYNHLGGKMGFKRLFCYKLTNQSEYEI